MWGNAFIQVFEYCVQAKWNGGGGDDSLKKEVEYCDQDVGVIHRKNK